MPAPAFNVGQRVTYRTPFKTEPGIVKSLAEDPGFVFVVYRCAGDWPRYQSYTAARTDVADTAVSTIDLGTSTCNVRPRDTVNKNK